MSDTIRRGPGRPKGTTKADKKVPVTIRLDPLIVNHFKRGNEKGWQKRMHHALRAWVYMLGEQEYGNGEDRVGIYDEYIYGDQKAFDIRAASRRRRR